jgi:hypothetical protein
MLVACVHELHREVGLLGEEVVLSGIVQSIVHEPRLPFSPGAVQPGYGGRQPDVTPPMGGFLASPGVWNGDIEGPGQAVDW